MFRRLFASLTIFAAFTLLAASAHADRPHRRRQSPHSDPRPLHLRCAAGSHLPQVVDCDIQDQVAVTSVDQEFYNPNNARLEGEYIFPIPVNAHISKFAMDIDGKTMEAELLPADKARSIYNEIVRQTKDPALLEYAGRAMFKVHIFPIEPNSRKRIQLNNTPSCSSRTTACSTITTR